MAARASCSRVVEAERSSNDGVVFDEETTVGVPITEGAGFG